MKIVVKIISYIFTFILMIALLLAILLGITTKTILDQDYMLAKLEETNYYEKVYSNILLQVEDYIEQSGLEEIDIHKVLIKEQVKTDTNRFFVSVYRGETIEVDQNEIEKQLKGNLEKELEEKEITLTQTEKKAMNKIVETIADSYSTEVSYGTYSQYIKAASQIVKTIDNMLSTVGVIVYILPAGLMAIILLFNFNQFRVGLRYIGIAALASGVLMIGANLFVKMGMDLPNLFLLNKATSDLVIAMLSDFLAKVNMAGIISTIVGIFAILIGATYRKEEEEIEED